METNDGQATSSAGATNAIGGAAAFAVGMIVQVEARTWPGINKPGGVGRITQIHHAEDSNEVTSVNVRYTVVGGRERRVPIQHVEVAPEFDAANVGGGDSAVAESQPRNMRDRSGLLGRCKRCGSLRADCGSCDWIEDEARIAEQTRNQPEQQANANTQQRRKKASRKKRKIRVSSEEESLSSSSEDEEQIKADNKRRRQYRRQRASWMRIMNDESATDDSDASSDNDDDPTMARLVDLERRRREEKKRRLARKYSVSTKKKRRPRSFGLSTLEALEKPLASGKISLNADNSRPSSPSLSPRRNIFDAQARTPAEVDNVGDADISSEDSLPPPDDGNEMEQASTTLNGSQDDSLMADASMEDLEGLGFIQPEGEAAAEHLPSGIVDQTQSVPYKELPVFFDNLMNAISNELIPDANVELQSFKRKVRDARKADDTDSLNRLKEEGAQLYREIQQRVIRDGMDQCQQAMRRMTSSRERRMHKEGMSRMELRNFRGTALEARDVRYDAVAKEAEKLLRDAIDALLNDFCEDDEMEAGDDEFRYDSERSNEVLEPSLNEDTFAALGTSRTVDNLTLPPFDPHMHASTVRGNTKPLRKRSGQRDASSEMVRRKLPKQNSERSTGDIARMPKSRSGGQTTKVHRSRRVNDLNAQQNDSFDSDSDNNSFGEDSISLEASDGGPMPPRKRRKAAKSQSRQREADINISQASGASERRHNQVSARDRMEAFARANALDVDDLNLSDESQKEPIQSRRQRRRQQFSGRREPSAGVTPTVDDEVTVFADEHESDPSHAKDSINLRSNISTEAFYRRVERKKRAPPTTNESRHQPASLSGTCKDLLSKYRDSADDCVALFDDIVNHFRVAIPIVHADAFETLTTLLQLLQDYGSITLMEAALSGARRFKRHIQLMVFSLRLLHCKVNSALTVDDGIAFKLFGGDSWKDFVEMLVLQLMDAIYARVQPTGWGLDNKALSGLFENLVPLRDAIGSLIPLVETISHCMLEKFQCQKWYTFHGNSDSSSFISALDPHDFKSLISTGSRSQLTPGSDSLRFPSFKKVIPRCETETIWVLLGFTAETPTEQTSVSKYRWRLLTTLFIGTAGVLSKEYFDASSNDETKLLPGEDHITQCRAEMSRFCVLVSSSALNPLPDSDSFLTKLVQKCLLLQAHEYLYSSDERGEELLGLYDAADRNRLSRTWKATHLLGQNTPEVGNGHGNSIPGGGSNDHTMGRMTGLQPISALLESCVKLSMAWIRQTPKKKARRSRLAQSLHSLIKDCIDCASKLEGSSEDYNNNVTAASTFEEAFAVRKSNAGALCAASAYREVAARLSVIATIGGSRVTSVPITKKLRETVWATMADSTMKKRQQLVVTGQSFAEEETYNGDVVRLFSTARTIAWFASLLWPGEKGTTTDQISPEVAKIELDDDLNMLLFLTSCLSSCLVCMCDVMKPQDNLVLLRNADVSAEFENAAISSICLWLSELCIRCREILNESIPEAESSVLRLKEAAQELRSKILTILAPTVQKCLLRLTNLTVYSENANLALLSVLSLTRAVVSLVATKVITNGSDTPQAPSNATQSTDEDLFGSMDDSLFMNIDLGTKDDQRPQDNPSRGQNETGDRDTRAFKDLWTILVDMIKSSKPSERFAILPSTMARTTSACQTVPGRNIAANNIGEIVACLAALTSLDKQDDQAVNSSLDYIARPVKSSGWRAREDSDQGYFRTAAQCFYSELCSVSAKYKQCDLLVRKRWDNIVEHFVDSMLDSNTLERFPSMNLKRIKENGGKRSERKQSLRLKLANSVQQSNQNHVSVNIVGARLGKGEKENCPGPAYNSSHLWSFCKSLGEAVGRHSEPSTAAFNESSRLGTLFCELDSDLVDRPRDTIPLVSLERECIKRFMLFRGILSYSSKDKSTEGVLSFESLSNLIISCCCYQLVSISKGLHYQARHGRMEANDGSMSYKHTRLLELQSCYTELTLALLSWILRECPTSTSKSATFEATLQCVRDQLFSQVLLKRSSDLHSSLERLYYIATTGTVANGIAVQTTIAEKDESGVLNDTFVAIVRRSREIMLHLALDQGQNGMSNIYCLFNSFISLATNCTASEEWMFHLIEESMGGDAASAITTSSIDSSRFQQALDGYMNHVCRSRGVDTEEQTALHQLRNVAIRKFLAPKLLKDDVPLVQKKNILHLLSYILQLENVQRWTVQEDFEIQLIVSMTKAIASCIRSALESPIVDDQLVSCAFQCSKSILTLPYITESVVGDSEETVLIWSHHCKDDVTTKPPFALYLWTFASWMNHIGAMLVTNHDTQRLQDFRSKAVSMTAQGQSIWSGKDTSDNVVLQKSSRLLSLEAQVFVEKENARPVMNVYAKSRSKPQPSVSLSVFVEWVPSSTVRRAVKELQAKVISVL